MPGFTETISNSKGSIDERIYDSWIEYLQTTLGRSKSFAHERARKELARTIPKEVIRRLLAAGLMLPGMKILEIGSGHGGLAVEMALLGAVVTAVEPCDPWRSLSEERARSLGLSIKHISADAQCLPFEDESFDACVSLQVLEHVRNPEHVIHEITRVLRPNGVFYISCENYLAFRENHYGVPWLPMLPKPVGSIYLQLLGRDACFLKNHVTYTTWPGVSRSLIKHGLISEPWKRFMQVDLENCPAKVHAAFRLLRVCLNESNARIALVWLANKRQIFRVGFSACGRKRSITS